MILVTERSALWAEIDFSWRDTNICTSTGDLVTRRILVTAINSGSVMAPSDAELSFLVSGKSNTALVL
jgi:hypothetical protein